MRKQSGLRPPHELVALDQIQEAELSGERVDPSRRALATDVKAATAHGLRVSPTAEGWTAAVTLDV